MDVSAWATGLVIEAVGQAVDALLARPAQKVTLWLGVAACLRCLNFPLENY